MTDVSAEISSHPELTIVVPSYNAAQYLVNTLESYADKRLRGLVEVIIIDDGSTDDTADIARDFVRRMPGIFRLISKSNGGHGSAVNTGIAAARGRYLRVIDADDWATTDELVRFVSLLQHVSSDLVIDIKTEVDMSANSTRTFTYQEDVKIATPWSIDELCQHTELIPYLMIHTLTIRSDYLRRIDLHLLEHTFYVDYEYAVKATIDAHDAIFFDTKVYNYLVGNTSQSVADSNYVRHWADHTRVTWEIVRLTNARKDLRPTRATYLSRRAELIVNTHYNIALIFDEDRHRGLVRARSFRHELRRRAPAIAAATEGRYRLTRILHAFGIHSQAQLNALLRRRWRSKY